MINKLKWRFIASIMAVAFAVLASVFAAVLLFTQKSLEASADEVLRRALSSPITQMFPGRQQDSTGIPCFTVLVDATGEAALVINNSSYTLDEQLVQRLCAECISRKEARGTLEQYGLRYLRVSGSNAIRIAFADTSLERSFLRGLTRDLALIGGSGLGVILLISFLLAGHMVRPISEAFEKQKRFVADASHELNTPLSVIISNVGLLSDEPSLGEEGEERLERIKYEAGRMKSLTGELLTLAHSADALPRSETRRADLSAAAERTALLMEPTFFESGRRLESEIAKDIFVSGSEEKLGQLIEILLDNARKYSAEGSASRLRLFEGARKKAVIEVQSFGETIPKDKLETVFERFYRADPARADAGGYGLGLPIARGIADAHHGTITAASENKKTVFTVVLPIDK